MKSLQKMVESIISELTKLQNAPLKRDKGEFPIPRMIAAGNGGSIIISDKIDHEITDVATQLMDDKPVLKSKFTQSEWRGAVRSAFGPALLTVDLDHDLNENAKPALQHVKAELNQAATQDYEREYALGCTLFSKEDLATLTLGPVRLENRNAWLLRKASEGAVTSRRIRQAWQKKPIGKRKASSDSMRERDIVAAIGSCGYVCSVTAKGLGEEAGQEKALTAARLALTAVALLRSL